MRGDLVPPALTVVVLTHNEEANLGPCLESVAGWAHQIFVVDSGSTDRTLEIARREGAQTVHHPFETHARQWDWAMRHLPLETDWILALDADQRLTKELGREIVRTLAKEPPVDGFFMKRRQIFRGKWIRYGGYYPKYLLKLFRRGKVSIDLDDLVDHHFTIEGPTAKLQHDMIEANRKEDDLSFWIEKHRRYALLLARQEVDRRGRPLPTHASLRGNPDERTLWLKHLWYRFPLFVRPLLYFIYRYFLRFGFLDGRQGLVFHYYQAFWFRLQVDLRIRELLRG